MTEMRDIVILDLDGVVCDSRHREWAIEAEGWDKFHSLCENDAPCTDIIQIVSALGLSLYDFQIIVITGRSERFRAQTMAWLAKHFVQVSVLLMRPNDNFQKSPDMKLRLIEEHLGENWSERILCIIDDHPGVISAFSAANVTTLHCGMRKNGQDSTATPD